MFSICLLLIMVIGVLGPNPYPNSEFDWHSFGDDWETSNKIRSWNPFYDTYRIINSQMDAYGYANHMGTINRGKLTNPELNDPRHRAYGPGSDFNPGDLRSGAFRYPSKGQRVKATPALVSLGMASTVGEVVVIPPGVQVQADGTVAVQLNPATQTDPCTPDPCSQYHLAECVAVNADTAKCIHASEYTLMLNYKGAAASTARYSLVVVPAKHDCVTSCPADDDYDFIDFNSNNDCGVEPGEEDYVTEDTFDVGDTTASTSLTLATDVVDQVDPDAPVTSYKDYTYQIFLHYDPDFGVGDGNANMNPDSAEASLEVFYNGKLVQTIDVPQGSTNPDRKSAYFFGCFVPMRGGAYNINPGYSGFYDTCLLDDATRDGNVIGDDKVLGNLVLGDPGLCCAINNA